MQQDAYRSKDHMKGDTSREIIFVMLYALYARRLKYDENIFSIAYLRESTIFFIEIRENKFQ